MKKIDINDENIDIYKELYDIKTGQYDLFNYRPGLCLLEILLNSITTGVCIVGRFPYIYSVTKILSNFSTPPHSETIMNIYKIAMDCYPIMCAIVIVSIGISIRNKTNKMNIKRFEKRNPDFDMNIDISELKKELDKYKKTSKTLEKQKEEDNLQNNNFKEMTNQEKIAFLEEVKEIIIQTQQPEKITEEELETNEVEYQKKIGTINQ